MLPTFPFTAIIGQESLKTALILSVIDPNLGGLLISGPRGCGKSTAARSLSDVIDVRDHFVNLPLGATEDRVIGTLDPQKILDTGEMSFSPGLLSKAHEGMLYVDEVNLLPDHLVDVLLDVSANGKNYVERDGVSHQHDARFVLVGTMNPDEGELRPQILDRFGLMVHLDGPATVQERIQITSRRLSYDEDPNRFCEAFGGYQLALQKKIRQAQSNVSRTVVSEEIQLHIAEVCHNAKVDGVRADITLTRAAKAFAAFHGSSDVSKQHIAAVEELVLCHRRNNCDSPAENSNNTANSDAKDDRLSLENPPTSDALNNGAQSQEEKSKHTAQGSWGELSPETVDTKSGNEFKISAKHPSIKTLKKKSQINLATSRSNGTNAGRIDGGSGLTSKRIDWLSTIRNSTYKPTANAQAKRSGTRRITELSFKRLRSCQKHLHVALLDTSSSAIGANSLASTKGIIQSIASQAYLRREQLCVIQFSNNVVKIIQSPIRPPKNFNPVLNSIKAGGGTPLRKALLFTETLFKRWDNYQRYPTRSLYLFTDGRTNDSISGIRFKEYTTVVDTERTPLKIGRSARIAEILGANYIHIDKCLSTTAGL